MNLTIKFAERCAWRAVYISRELADGYGRHQFFHLGVDPNNGIKPACFGSLLNPLKRRGRCLRWRFTLPYIRWTYPAGPVRKWAYSLSSRFWHQVDGRTAYYAAQRAEAGDHRAH